MPEITKKDVIDVLAEIALLLEISAENPFKVRAYQNAARTLEALDDDFHARVAENRLEQLKGIGSAIAEKITALVMTGSLPYYEELKASIPAGLLEMLRVPGFGPKKAKAVYKELGVEDLAGLEAAARDGRLAGLSGMGARTVAKVLEGIAFVRQHAGQHLLGEAVQIAAEVLTAIRAHESVSRAEIAGSLRRGRELVKDIDIVAATSDPEAVMALFVSLPQAARVTGRGSAKASVLLPAGRGPIACDLRACDDGVFPFLLHHLTGSREHNVAMRRRALKRGYSLSEWGLFKGKSKKSRRCADEAAIFRDLELAYIPPELREDQGEIAAAEAGALPTLIEPADIRADLHLHTTDSDGGATIEQMAEAGRARGYAYMGIADHSQSAAYAGGLRPDALDQQARRIDRLNEKYGPKFTVLKSSEVDILADGALDFDDKTLAGLDYVVASVHSQFSFPSAKMTARIIAALEHPATTILGHATGRLLLEREGYALAIDEVLAAAAENHVAVEINANPHRLDLDWRCLRRARDRGVKLAINTDAHRPEHLGFMRFGVGIARKGWLEKCNVINTLTVEQFKTFAAKKK